MLRAIEGFRQDELGDWVANLDCLHSQHVRHRPPFRDRPWVLTAEGRRDRLGTELDCPLCDRAELPGDLHVIRTVGPFDADNLPAGLRADHRVARGVWGQLRVLEGAVTLAMETTPPLEVRLVAGRAQPIPPGVSHRVVPEQGMQIEVDFLRRAEDSRSA